MYLFSYRDFELDEHIISFEDYMYFDNEQVIDINRVAQLMMCLHENWLVRLKDLPIEIRTELYDIVKSWLIKVLFPKEGE